MRRAPILARIQRSEMNVNDTVTQTHQNVSTAAVPQHGGLPPYLTIKQVIAVTTLARSSIYNRMSDTKDPLPRPLRVGRRVMWSRDEVLQYMNDRLRVRDRAQERRQARFERPHRLS